MTGNIIFISTVKTGLYEQYELDYKNTWNWPRMIQIAWGIYSPEGVLIAESAPLVRPNGFAIPPASTKTHGIDHKKVTEEGRMVSIVLDEFEAALNDVSMVVGHDLYFDYNVVMAEFERFGRRSKLGKLEQYSTRHKGMMSSKLADDKNTPSLDELYRSLFNEAAPVDTPYQHPLTETRNIARCFFKMKKV
jgi:DNA polymerase III epsilon subunit-like protein